jgi:hypothetical protein
VLLFAEAISLSANAFSLASNVLSLSFKAVSRASNSLFRSVSCASAAESCLWQEQIVAKQASVERRNIFFMRAAQSLLDEQFMARKAFALGERLSLRLGAFNTQGSVRLQL